MERGKRSQRAEWTKSDDVELTLHLEKNTFSDEVCLFCVFIKSSAIDEGSEFRIPGTRRQHHESGPVVNVVPVFLSSRGDSAFISIGTKAGEAPFCASSILE